MRYCYLIVLSTFINSLLLCCKPKQEIPDTTLITDIIAETIEQDSLNKSIPISYNLVNRYIYKLERDTLIEYLPPPPRNKNGEPFVFSKYFDDSVSPLKFNQADSIFIAQQILLNKNIKLDISRIPDNIKIKSFPVLDRKGQDIYIFLVPLFNKDKSLAMVEYDYDSSCCGYGRIVFFRRVGNQWIKVATFGTWIT